LLERRAWDEARQVRIDNAAELSWLPRRVIHVSRRPPRSNQSHTCL
jgi:hypothetical protein